MGMYAEVMGRTVKMSGLLATAVVSLKGLYPDDFPGVAVTKMQGTTVIDGGAVTLAKDEIREVVIFMRNAFVHGRKVEKYDIFSDDSLSTLQDIYHFRTDVDNLATFATWVHQETPDQIIIFS